MSRELSDIFTDEILALPTGKRKKAALAALREAEAPEIAAEKDKARREAPLPPRRASPELASGPSSVYLAEITQDDVIVAIARGAAQ